MQWKGYQISLRLLSPLHIGWRKSGNLQQTRPYVTGRALWGALTSRLTREAGQANYEEVGQEVDDRLAFTYFYPSDCPNSVHIWPWAESWDEFAWTYLGSYVSTSLADGHAAEEGSLHETEFIAPRTREDKPVYLLGYIFQREDWHKLHLDLDATLGKLQIGGERGYGWGRLSLLGMTAINTNDQCFETFKFAGDVGSPILEATCKKSKLLAHASANDEDGAGEVEPLIGRITKPDGAFGMWHSEVSICRKPGTPVDLNDKFSIQPKGLWQKL